MLGVCLMVVSYATPTPQSAIIASQDPQPAPIKNFQIVDTKGIYRSGQPNGDADWEYLKEIDITTVVKLNNYSCIVDEDKEFQLAKSYDIEVICIYVHPEDFPYNLNLWAGPDKKDLMKEINILEKRREDQKILVHCSHEKDRMD
jgi:hypothetical protein